MSDLTPLPLTHWTRDYVLTQLLAMLEELRSEAGQSILFREALTLDKPYALAELQTQLSRFVNDTEIQRANRKIDEILRLRLKRWGLEHNKAQTLLIYLLKSQPEESVISQPEPFEIRLAVAQPEPDDADNPDAQ